MGTMTVPKQEKVPSPQEVVTLPWEQSGGDPGLDEMADRFQARFGEEESGGDPAPPRDTDGPAEADEEDDDPKKGEKPEAEAESDDEDEDTDEESPESDDEDEDTDEESPESDDEGEESDEEDADGSDDEDPTKDIADDTVIEINGERVTLKELKDSGLRQADYTRKTQALADKSREVETQREEYKGKLEVLHGVLEKVKGAEPDWVKLAGELEPKDFQARKAAYDQAQREMDAVATEHAKVVEKQRTDAEVARKGRIDAESAKLVEAIPTWKDPKVAEKEQGELTDYAVGLGFTPETLEGVEDHRVFVMLHKAMLYDRGQAKEAEVAKEIKAKVQKPPKGKSLKPGVQRGPAKKSKAAEKRITDARARLAQSGNLRDAAAVFAEYLEG